MGRIYRRGNRYYVDYEDENGKRIRKSAGSTRQEAREFLRSQGQGIEESTSLQELIDDYLRSLEVHAKRSSITEATYCARRLSRFFDDSPVMSLTVRAQIELERRFSKTRHRAACIRPTATIPSHPRGGWS